MNSPYHIITIARYQNILWKSNKVLFLYIGMHFTLCFCLKIKTGIRLGEKLMKTKMFKSLGAKSLSRIHPACSDHSYGSNSYWECFVRHNTYSLYHPVGTCKMGASDDPTAVVDSHLRFGNFINTLQSDTICVTLLVCS